MLVNKVIAATSPLEDIYAPGKALGGSSATLSDFINPLIANILIISGIFAFFVILFAGFSYITAGGDKAKIEQAQQMLNYGILGLIVIVVAFVITRLIGSVIGFKFF